MSDTTDTAAQPQQPTGPSLRILNQYIKDLSFENPGARVNEQPNVDLGIDVQANAQNRDEGVYEVVLKLNARAGTKDTALFLVELEYGGLFQLQGASQADTEAMLLIECPRLLFPFARRLVADLTQEGGFPPLRIDPVDFTALYRQQRARAQQPATNGGGAAAAPAPNVETGAADAPAGEPENKDNEK
ncbi:MAG: protein-export chaperone SecB [Henriciella sp.]|jgi:preprotein translocase subunit SecB|uniref:protein-export chaperone SecB n=1 Tax=uncultured Henriciella sp. TaxID=1608424 RepID=UPI000C61850A|nr:protein-export chaperone SecB [Henriciella sp.]MBF33670.1 protein-export chaperone SecB [Hyphomonadaceae bacterium]